MITHNDFINARTLNINNAPAGAKITLLYDRGRNDYSATLIEVVGWDNDRMLYMTSAPGLEAINAKEWHRYRVLPLTADPLAQSNPIERERERVSLRDQIMLALIDKIIPAQDANGTAAGPHEYNKEARQAPNPAFHAQQLVIWTNAILKAHTETVPKSEYKSDEKFPKA